jgi:hypothetical protein
MASRISPDTIMYSPIENNDSNLKQVRLELLTKINELTKEVHDVRDKNNDRIKKVKNFLDYLKTEVIQLKKCCDTKGSSSANRVPQRVSGLFNSIPHNLFDTVPQPQVSSSAASSRDAAEQLWDQLKRGDPRWAEVDQGLKAIEETKRQRDSRVKGKGDKKGGKNKKKQTRKRRKTKRRVTKQ